MWSLRAWQRKRILARNPIDAALWRNVLDSLPLLDGLSEEDLRRLHERAVLFLHEKRLTPLPGVELQPEDRLRLALQAQLPLLGLDELGWYRGFHEIVLYPDDFLSPQKYRDRKSTRLNSSHVKNSYAVFCLKKKKGSTGE